MNRKILVIDQGTTGTRVALYNEDGTPVPGGWAYREHAQIYPRPGWVEHNPLEIWEKTLLCMKEALQRSKTSPEEVSAIGVTNQRETVVVWDPRSGQPLYNALVWQDRRTAPITDNLRKTHFSLIYEKTGLVPDPYFSATKIQWLLENVEGLREKMIKGEAIFGTIDTWIIWNLTRGSRETATPEKGGAHITDYSNASRTMLFNIHRLQWDEELLSLMGNIDADSLPIPRPSSDKDAYGYTGPETSGVFEGKSIPVTGDAGDQQAALFGQAGFEEGEVKCTYGTGNFILLNTGGRGVKSRNNLLTTVFYSLEEGRATYALEGSIFITGAAIQWLRDGLKLIEVSPEVDPLAEATDDTGGLYFVPAFTGLGAPYWDPYARGLIIGITRGTTRRHIARAVIESIAYLTRDVIEAMERDIGARIKSLKADGGAAKSDVLLQFQADILGVEVLRPLIRETTSLGVAYLAGLAVGLWSSLDEIKSLWKAEKVFKPQMELERRERLYKGWKSAVSRALGWAKEIPWAYGYE
ncbi:MAG: glycerol kinase GlpK [Infirmifilum sp.]